jgi:large subunit ribosomal protein L25
MPKARPQLTADKRTVFGRQVRNLRRQGIVPATVYGKDIKSLSVQIPASALQKIFIEVGESGLVDLTVGQDVLPVILRNPQYHPVSNQMLHLDFYKVNLKEKITTTIPVELTGESPAVKTGNILVEVTDEVEVEALPTDLPEKFLVDTSRLENLNQTITVADLQIDKSKIEIKTPLDQVIVKIEAPKEEEVEEATPPPEEVPATEQTPKEGGEATATPVPDKSEDKKGHLES